MTPIHNILHTLHTYCHRGAILLCLLLCSIISAQGQIQELKPVGNTQQATSGEPTFTEIAAPGVELDTISMGSIEGTTLATDTVIPGEIKVFNPDGMRAVWLSALCPGLGQIYNHRYWKLPIVVGGFAGLIYATTWNGRMLSDYQQAYLDILDTDPTTNSYMNFFPPYYTEDDIDKSWLTNLLKTRKDAYRHYRDYCVVGMVALYLVCILDAYVDAELYHFDMSVDLAVDVKPALIPTSIYQRPALGLQCAITF